MRPSKLPIFIKSFSWVTAFCLATPSLFATSLTVDVVGDANVATGGTFAVSSGDLRGVLNFINQNPDTYDVSFALGGSNTITLSAMLPLLNLNVANTVSIDGTNGGTPIVIDGASTYRGFFARQGTISVQNLTIQNVNATGGAGGLSFSGGGGGGMGAGAGFFVDGAAVTLSSVTINNATAVGGAGGVSTPGPEGNGGGSGGGGMGGAGGIGGTSASFPSVGPGGGGGIGGVGGAGGDFVGGGGGGGINCGTNFTGTGGDANGFNGLAGGGLGGGAAGDGGDAGFGSPGTGGATGGGGGGGGEGAGGGGGGVLGSSAASVNPGAGGYGGGAGGSGNAGVPSIGGFGGGGGGDFNSFTGLSGAGGFGGGGGGKGAPDNGGTGGFGGGGGGSTGQSGIGAGFGGVGGGRGGVTTDIGGGGGAGFGGAVFVNTGSLTFNGAFTSGTNTTNFGAGSGTGVQGWNAGDHAFIVTGGTLAYDPNGSTITITSSIADDSPASFVGAPAGVTPGIGAGGTLVVGSGANPAGTMNLPNANTYSGGTTFNKGTLNVGNNTSLGAGTLTFATTASNILQPTTAGLNLANAMTMSVAGVVDTNGNTLTLSGNIGGASSLTKQGTGTLILSGTNNYAGGTVVNVGTVQANNTASLPSGGNMSLAGASTQLILNAGSGTFTVGDLSGVASSSVNLNSNTLAFGTATASVTYPGSISGTAGSLTKQGSGIAILTGTNIYVGTTTVSAGTLEIDTTASLPSATNVNLSGATAVLDLSPASGAFTIGDLTGVSGSNLNLGTSTLTFGTATTSTTFSGSITGTTATLTKNGTGAALLLGTGTFTGGTTFNQGTLGVGTSTSLGSGTLTFATNSGNILQAEATLSMANPIVLDMNGTADSNGFNLTLSGGISGVGALTKIGAGALILPNANTYSGGTNLDLGTLQVGNNTSLGTNTLTFETNAGNILQAGANVSVANPIVLNVNGTVDTNGFFPTLSGGISGVGSLKKISLGTLLLPNANTYSGGTLFDQGSLFVGTSTSLGTGSLTFETNNGNILIAGAAGLNLANAIVLTTNGTINVNNNSPLTLSGGISGAGILTKVGVGTLILPNANTYSGGTNLNLDTLQVGNNTSLGTGLLTFQTSGGNILRSGAANLNLANNILLSLSGTVNANGNTFTLSGGISGTGLLSIVGNGTLVLSNANTYSGGTQLNLGTVRVGTNTSLGTNTLTFLSNPGNILQSGAAGLNLANAISLITNGSVDTNSNTMTLSGGISGASILTKIGAGTLILPNANTYSGGTHLDLGTVRVGNNTSLGTNTLTFETNAGNILQSGAAGLNLANAIVLTTSGSVDTNSNIMTLSGGISGAGALTKIGTGTLILPNANTYGGATNLNQGTLNVGNNTSLSTSTLTFQTNAGNVLQSGAAALNLANAIVLTTNGSVDTNSNTMTLSGGISGASILTKIGAGTLILPNANTYTNGTHLDLGTVQVGNNTSLAAGTLTFETNAGNILQSGAAALNLANAIVLTTSGSVDTNGNTMTLSGGISGAGALTKIGLGDLILPNANTYGGGTNLSQGTLNVGNNTSLGAGTLTFQTNVGNILQSGAAGLNLANAIVLTTSGSVDTNSNTLTLSGGISGAGALTKISAGTLILPNANTYGGGTNLDLGTVRVGNSTSLGTGTLTFQTNAGNILQSGAAALNLANAIVLTTSGSVDTNSNTLTLSGGISGAGALTKISAGTLILPNANTYGGGTNLDLGTVQVGNNTSLGAGTLTFQTNAGNILQSGAAGLNLANAIVLTTSGSVDTNSNIMTLSGGISGAGALTKIGAGTLILPVANTYGGGTNLDQGTLNVGNNTSLGAGTLTFQTNAGNVLQSGAAALNLANAIVLTTSGSVDSNSNTLTLSGGISGAGALTKISAGTLILPNANTYGGGTNLNQGTLNVGNNTSLGAGTLTFQTNAGNVLQSGAAALNLANAIVLTTSGSADTNGNTMTLSGGISGAGALSKIGAGTLILPSANTYAGGTNLDLGTVRVGNNTSLGAGTLTFETNAGNILQSGAAALNLANAIVLTTSGSADTNGNTLTLSGGISGAGALTKISAGTLILPNANTYSGGTNLDLGTVQVGTNTSLGSGLFTFETNNGNTLQSGAASLNLANNILLTANGVVDSNGNTFTLSGGISGAGTLTKIGTGTLILSNANTYSAGTTLSQGTLGVGTSTSLGSGTLTFATNSGNILQAEATLALANPIVLNVNGTADSNGFNLTLSGGISGVGSLTKIGLGSLILPNANTYGGGTNLNQGTLNVGNNTSLGAGALTFQTNAGNVLQSGAAALNLANAIVLTTSGSVDTNSNTMTLSGGISGAGALTKIGAGTLILPIANTYGGGTNLDLGTVRVGNNTSLGAGTLTFQTNAGNVLQSGAAALNLANAIVLTTSGSADTNGNTMTLSGGISGAGALSKIGAGTLILPSANTYGGGTNLDLGTVRVGNNTSLGAGTLTFETNAGNILQSGAAGLNLANAIVLTTSGSADTNGNTLTLSGSISGAGALTKIGAGTLILPNANTYGGGTNLDLGTVQVGTNTSLGSGLFTFETNNGNTLQSGAASLNLANNILLSTNGIVDSNGNTFTLSGGISGAGTLTKIGTGSLILSNANTYSGGTTLTQGTLGVGTGTSLGSGTLTFATNSGNILQAEATLSMANPIVLNVNGTADTNGFNLTLSGGISGAGSFTKIGLGSLILSNANTYAGGTDLDQGTLNVGNNTSLGAGTLTFQTNAGNVLQSGAAALNLANAIVLTTSGSVDTNSNTMTLSGGISGAGALTKIGAGTLILPIANTYAGGTNLGLGTLQVGNNTALGTNTLTFQTNAGNILQSGAAALNLANAVVLTTSGSVDTNSNTMTLSGGISGPGALTKIGAGTLILSGIDTYTGGTNINVGTLQINTAASLPFGGPVTLASATTLDLSPVVGTATVGNVNGGAGSSILLGAANLTMESTGASTFAGSLSGTGTVIKQGSGTFTLSGGNPFSGIFNVNAGILNLTGSLSAGSTTNIASGATLTGTGTLGTLNTQGTLSPGNSIGTLSAVNVHFFTGSNYVLEISDTASDLITASGTLTIDSGSTVTVTPLGVTTPLNSYTILTSALPIVGSGNFTLVNTLPRFNFMLQYTPNDVFLTLTSINAFTATGNGAGVAKAFNKMLDTNPNTPGLAGVVAVLSAQTQSQLDDSFNQMQPANMDDLAFAEENVAERVRQTFSTRLFEQRVEACPDKEPWRIWIVPFVEHVHQRGHNELRGYKENFRGFSTGLDYQFQKNWAITTGFSFVDSDVSIVHGNAHGSFKTYAGTLGAIWTDSNFFIDGLVSYLFNTVDGKRKMRFKATGVSTVQYKARHSQDTNEVMGHFGGGYDWKIIAGKHGTVNIYPFVDVDYFFLKQDAYIEKGAQSLDLKVYRKDYDLLRPEGGIGFGYAGCFHHANLNFDVTASYIREQRFLGKKTKARFEHGPKKFTVRGLNPRNNLFGTGARITITSTENANISLSFGYHGEFGEHFIENAGDAEVKIAF